MPDKADSQPFAAAFAQAFNKRGRLEIYRAADGDWAWRVRSVHNGKITGQGEGYRRRGDMLKTLGWMFPGVEPVEVEGPEEPEPFKIAAFDPADTAPAGDPETDCTGEGDGAL